MLEHINEYLMQGATHTRDTWLCNVNVSCMANVEYKTLEPTYAFCCIKNNYLCGGIYQKAKQYPCFLHEPLIEW